MRLRRSAFALDGTLGAARAIDSHRLHLRSPVTLPIFLQTTFGNQQLVLRAFGADDVVKVVDYWHSASPEFLHGMGADPAKLSTREATTSKISTAIHGTTPRTHVAMAVDLDGRLVAYSNAYVDEPGVGYPHVHVLDPSLRSRGLSSALFRHALDVYFKHFALSKLMLMTSPGNVGVNTLLQKFGLKPRQEQVDKPSGMSRPGIFLVYEISSGAWQQLQAGSGQLEARMQIRSARISDLDALAQMCSQLWPDTPAADHRAHALGIVRGTPDSTLPLTILVAVAAGRAIGFVEVGLRSHAEGCNPAYACGFIEGWFVAEDERRKGVGRALIDRAEAWARGQGCVDLGSNTWLDDTRSQAAHAALGFEVAERSVHFTRPIRDPLPRASAVAVRTRPPIARRPRSGLRAARRRRQWPR